MNSSKAIKLGSTILTVTLMGQGFIPLANAQNRPNKVEEKLEQARQKQQEVGERIEQIKERQASKSAELQLRRAENQERIQEKLAGAKLEVCQKRQNRILSQTDKISDRSLKLLSKMGSIATKAEEFKTAKGISTSDLTTLETEMEDSKAAVEVAIEAAKASVEDFDCESDGPKAQLQQFVEAMDIVRTSLKSYRDSIHDYVQAIRQANGQNRTEEASSSAEPSPTPEASNSAEETE